MGIGRIISYAGVLFVLFLMLVVFINPEILPSFFKSIFGSYIPLIIVFFVIYVKIISFLAKKIKESNERKKREKVKEWEIKTIDEFYSE